MITVTIQVDRLLFQHESFTHWRLYNGEMLAREMVTRMNTINVDSNGNIVDSPTALKRCQAYPVSVYAIGPPFSKE